jgi:hypothetical protein
MLGLCHSPLAFPRLVVAYLFGLAVIARRALVSLRLHRSSCALDAYGIALEIHMESGEYSIKEEYNRQSN